MDKKKKKQKRADRIGIACGILLVAVGILMMTGLMSKYVALLG